MVTLELLMKMPSLRELKVVAGHSGLSREVRVVSVIDAPDSYKWLKGYELILTTGFLVGGDAETLEFFVLNLIDMGSCGLAIKKERFVKQIPENVISTADKHGFPIIEMPSHFVWSDVIAVFYELLYSFAEKNTQPIETEQIELIYSAMRWGSSQLMDKLTDLFHVPIAVIMKNKKIKADNGMPGVKHIGMILENSPLFPENMSGEILTSGSQNMTVCPIPLSRMGHAEYIAVMSHSADFICEIQKLFHLLSNIGEKESVAATDRARIYRDFILKFLSGKITLDDIHSFEEFRRTDETAHTAVMLIQSEDAHAVYHQMTDVVKSNRLAKKGRVNSHIVENAAKGESVVMLELYMRDGNCAPEIWQQSFIEDMEYYMQEKHDGYISIGRFYPKLEDIISGYREALEALTVGKALWDGRRCFQYSLLSVYNVLRRSNLSQIDLSYMQLLDDNRTGLSFDGIQTLEAFIERGGYKKAAAFLYVHENTLRYRVQKIGEVLCLDMEDPVIINFLIMQIKLWKLIKNRDVYGNLI